MGLRQRLHILTSPLSHLGQRRQALCLPQVLCQREKTVPAGKRLRLASARCPPLQPAGPGQGSWEAASEEWRGLFPLSLVTLSPACTLRTPRSLLGREHMESRRVLPHSLSSFREGDPFQPILPCKQLCALPPFGLCRLPPDSCICSCDFPSALKVTVPCAWLPPAAPTGDS